MLQHSTLSLTGPAATNRNTSLTSSRTRMHTNRSAFIVPHSDTVEDDDDCGPRFSMTTTTISSTTTASSGGGHSLHSSGSSCAFGADHRSPIDHSPPPTPPIRHSSLRTSNCVSAQLQQTPLPSIPNIHLMNHNSSMQLHQHPHQHHRHHSNPIAQHQSNSNRSNHSSHSPQFSVFYQPSAHHLTSNGRPLSSTCLIASAPPPLPAHKSSWPFAPGFTGKRKPALVSSASCGRLSPIDDDGGFKSLETMFQHKRNSISCGAVSRSAMFTRHSQPPLPPIPITTITDRISISDRPPSTGDLHTAHPVNVGTPFDSLLSDDPLECEYQNLRSDAWSSSASTRSSAYTAATSDYYTGSSDAMTASPSLSSLSTCVNSNGVGSTCSNLNRTISTNHSASSANHHGSSAHHTLTQRSASMTATWSQGVNLAQWTTSGCHPPPLASGIALSSAVDRPKRQHTASVLYYVVAKNPSDAALPSLSPSTQSTHLPDSDFNSNIARPDKSFVTTTTGSSSTNLLSDQISSNLIPSGSTISQFDACQSPLRSSASATDLKTIQKRAVYEFYLRHRKSKCDVESVVPNTDRFTPSHPADCGTEGKLVRGAARASLNRSRHSTSTLTSAVSSASSLTSTSTASSNTASATKMYSTNHNHHALHHHHLKTHAFSNQLSATAVSLSSSASSQSSSTSSSGSCSPATSVSSTNSLNSTESPSPTQSNHSSPCPASTNAFSDEDSETIGFTVTAQCAEVLQEAIYCNLPSDQTDSSFIPSYQADFNQNSNVSFLIFFFFTFSIEMHVGFN